LLLAETEHTFALLVGIGVCCFFGNKVACTSHPQSRKQHYQQQQQYQGQDGSVGVLVGQLLKQAEV
jgi:hypothetical protein